MLGTDARGALDLLERPLHGRDLPAGLLRYPGRDHPGQVPCFEIRRHLGEDLVVLGDIRPEGRQVLRHARHDLGRELVDRLDPVVRRFVQRSQALLVFERIGHPAEGGCDVFGAEPAAADRAGDFRALGGDGVLLGVEHAHEERGLDLRDGDGERVLGREPTGGG